MESVARERAGEFGGVGIPATREEGENQLVQRSKTRTSARRLDWMRSRAGQLNREEDKRKRWISRGDRKCARTPADKKGKNVLSFRTVHIAFIYMLLIVI